MKYELKKVTMSDGNVNAFHSWLPEGEIKACMIISHGMAEHGKRYERFADVMTKSGYAVYCEDHRGHGETAKMAVASGTGKFGYLADKKGFFRVVDDIHEEVGKLKEWHPGKKIVLFGHSFGSFVTQCFIEKYGKDIDSVVICGTAGPAYALVGFASVIGAVVNVFAPRKKVSKFMDKAAFGAYNNKIKKPRTQVDWLSRDEAEVDKYIADDWCGFVCTVGFYRDLFAGLTFIHKKNHMKMVPADLPVLFIDGTADPVGAYSKTVVKLSEIYKANGVRDVTLKLYEDARHELLNETNRDEITQDVLSWVESKVSC